MKNLVHLDCSLRDGGYYNNWDFSEEFINSYLQVLESIKVDYCEIGFRFTKNMGFKGSCAFTSEKFLDSLQIPNDLKIAIMLNANELVIDNKLNFEVINKLIPVKAKDSKVKLIRVACHSELIKTILPLFDFLSESGYLVACNITQITEKSEEEINKISKYMASSKVDIVYIADSLGSLSPNQISKISELINRLFGLNFSE